MCLELVAGLDRERVESQIKDLTEKTEKKKVEVGAVPNANWLIVETYPLTFVRSTDRGTSKQGSARSSNIEYVGSRSMKVCVDVVLYITTNEQRAKRTALYTCACVD